MLGLGGGADLADGVVVGVVDRDEAPLDLLGQDALLLGGADAGLDQIRLVGLLAQGESDLVAGLLVDRLGVDRDGVLGDRIGLPDPGQRAGLQLAFFDQGLFDGGAEGDVGLVEAAESRLASVRRP